MSDFVTHRDLEDPYGEWRRGEPVGTCEYCGEEIYEDEYYYEIEACEKVHQNCFNEYMENKYETCLIYPA